MHKSKVRLIIFFAGLAMIGIIFIQFYWMKNAFQLQEKLFDDRVNVALKSVVNRMFDEKLTPEAPPYVCSPDCDRRTSRVLMEINPVRLDSLLHEEFDGMEITRKYAWGVFDPHSTRFFMGETGSLQENIIESDHKMSLSCLYRNEQLLMGVYFPQENKIILMRVLPWVLLSLVFVGIIIYAFSWMIFSFKKQKKLSDIKSDFVNNMTHELKTPISTISLASEMLLNSNGNLPDEKKQKYIKMIFDENMRLQQQVEQVLQMAILEKGSFKLELSLFDAHDIIEKCINRFDLVIKNNNGRIIFNPAKIDSWIEADLTHFQNVICNLLDNAVKYSGPNPEITVSTKMIDKKFAISFKDKGIGISQENQKMIFEKLYRVPTGNVHNVKGFGLGLYYVKTIIEALGGEVRVQSEVNKGSNFEIVMPYPVKTNIHESKS